MKPRWHRRRHLRTIVLLVAAFLIAGFAYQYAKPINERVTLIWHQHRLAKGLLPPDQVVFEEDPTVAAALRNRDARFVAGTRGLKDAAAFALPPEFKQYPVGRFPLIPATETVAPLFIGERTDEDGARAIIYVCAGLGLTPGAQLILPMTYWCDPLAPWTPDPAGRVLGGSNILGGIRLDEDRTLWPLNLHRNLTLYAGVADPKDAQRFTVRYALDRETGTIEFRVKHVGEIQIKVLDGPLVYERQRAWADAMRKKSATAPTAP
jgi:hypothetical protein